MRRHSAIVPNDLHAAGVRTAVGGRTSGLAAPTQRRRQETASGAGHRSARARDGRPVTDGRIQLGLRVCSTLRFSPQPCEVCDAAPANLSTSALRNSGHPRSKLMELPLLSRRARSCRSRRCAAIAPRTAAEPALSKLRLPVGDARLPRHIQGTDPLSTSLPNRRGPRLAGTCPCPDARPARSPRTACVTFHGFRVGCTSRRCGTRRGIVPSLLDRRSGGRPPPACLQASSPVAAGPAVAGALTLTEPLGRTSSMCGSSPRRLGRRSHGLPPWLPRARQPELRTSGPDCPKSRDTR